MRENCSSSGPKRFRVGTKLPQIKTDCSKTAESRLAKAAIAVLAFAGVFASKDASAFTIETQVTQGCHESITLDALRQVRTSLATAAPLPDTDPNDAPLINDLPFTVPSDLSDIGGATLLIGVRDNDLKNLAATTLDALAVITADPAGQREHCLRMSDETEPAGAAQAVSDCRFYIREKLISALDGLGADGKPDPHVRDSINMTFAVSGQRSVLVPAFYLRMGQAVHAIQDSFTHTFRNVADRHKIITVLNWVDYADKSLDESTSGPKHMSELDRCDDPDPLRTERHHLAIEATAAALHTALDPTLTREAKIAGFDALLDSYVLYDTTTTCNAGNSWCNAPENQYRTSSCGCSIIGQHPGGAAPLVGGIALLLFVLARRRRSRASTQRVMRPKSALSFAPVAVLCVGGIVCISTPASAQQTSLVPDAPEHKAAGPLNALEGDSLAAKPGFTDPGGSIFGHAAIGLSYDHAALAGALGARYELSQKWMVGIDFEWNPWLPVQPVRLRAGSGNVYASLMRRYQMAYESVNLRTTASLGASVLLMDLPGAPAASFGPLIGISFLGVEWKIANGYYLVVDPSYLMFPVPHLTGTPLGYYQYRFQFGLEFGG